MSVAVAGPRSVARLHAPKFEYSPLPTFAGGGAFATVAMMETFCCTSRWLGGGSKMCQAQPPA